ncbi:hypothetical protein CKAH01_05097 [Colletotrichum kahawae]|uniref:Uncharacterized protein n=1 Tax=Colletotrichum kahawae TaxID=34407 RepID=A0AAE0D8W6_COLKA|nr:hypothetical protein CKAH01_05097 [Colletotrichum kahawae]
MCLSGGGNLEEAHGDSMLGQRTAGNVAGLFLLFSCSRAPSLCYALLLLIVFAARPPCPSHLSPGRAEVMVLAPSTGLAGKLEVPWPIRLCHPISCFYASCMVHALAGSAPALHSFFFSFAIIPSLSTVVPGVTWTVGGSPWLLWIHQT